jgi:peptidyl-prolyl cis-trans isomerase D
MLEAIRKRSASFVVKGLMGLLILSFAVWGIGDVISGRVADAPVATIGDLEIRPGQLSSEFRRELTRMQRMLGDTFDAEQARRLGVVDAVLGRMVERSLFDLGGNSLGLLIDNDQVIKQIQGSQAFRGTVGGFDRNLFYQVLQNSGFSEDQYIELVRQDLARAQLLTTIRAGGVAPSSLVDVLYRHRQQKRIAETLFVADSAMADPGQPDTEALAKFHKDNAARFTAPEYRTLTAVILRAEDLAKEIAIAEETLRQSFAERRDEFEEPERRHIWQMVLADEATAVRAKGMLDQGRDFAAVAKEVAGLTEDVIDIGVRTHQEILPELADVAFGLAMEAHSGPVESPLGWHVVRVSEIQSGTTKTFAEVRAILTKDLAAEQSIDGLFELANRLEDALGSGASIEEAAGRTGVDVVRIEAIDATGRDRHEQTVPDLPSGQQFLSTAFATDEGQESVLSEAGNDVYFVLRVDAATPPALRPLDQVRERVVTAWQAERRSEAAKTLASNLETSLKGGGDAAAVAAQSKAEFAISAPFIRNPTGETGRLSPSMIGNLFALKVGGVTSGRVGDGYAVARLTEIQAATPSDDSLGVETLGRQISDAMQGDILNQFSEALRARYPVTTNTGATENIY